jgi:hypothetical protein
MVAGRSTIAFDASYLFVLGFEPLIFDVDEAGIESLFSLLTCIIELGRGGAGVGLVSSSSVGGVTERKVLLTFATFRAGRSIERPTDILERSEWDVPFLLLYKSEGNIPCST